jgi:putative membrane protein
MLLSPEDHARIEAATRAAEATTRGEIVCVVAEEASHYREVPLAWAAVAALVLPIAPLMLGAAAVWLDDGLRGWSAAHVAASHATVMTVVGGYALTQCLVFIVVVALVSIPSVRRVLTPGSLRRGHVHLRAMEQFHARDLHTTKERTGVLIYASLKDRVAVVIADSGINTKVGAQGWRGVVALLTSNLKAGRPGDGFVLAIEACGRLLATHFPATGPNPDELPDTIVEAPNS